MKSAGKTFFKNLILALTLVIIVLLFCIAWFSSRQEASASGLTVKSGSASGLESSLTGFDGTDWSFEHTKDVNLAFPLITGNGKADKFFLPVLNLSTGIPAYEGSDPDSKWNSKRQVYSTKNPSDDGGADYIEQDIYFRSEQPLSVYLRSDSTVGSQNIEAFKTGQPFGNISPYGSFPTDFIAATARVSFSEVVTENDTDTESLKYVWAPNDTYQLVGDGSFTELEPQSTGGTGFNPPSTDGWGLTGEDSEYYLWAGYHYKSGANSGSTYFTEAIQLKKDDNGRYYGVVDIVGDISSVDYMVYVGEYQSETPTDSFRAQKDNEYNTTDGEFTVYASVEGNFTADNRDWARLYITTNNQNETFCQKYNKFQVRLYYEPVENGQPKMGVDGLIFYDNADPTVVGGDVELAGIGMSYIYPIEDGDNIIISAYESQLALTPDVSGYTGGYSMSDGKIASYQPESVFTVETITNSDTFYLKSLTDEDKYLYINLNSGQVADFTLSESNKTGFRITKSSNGPALMFWGEDGDSYYLDYSNNLGFFQSASMYSLKIYKGSSYSINTVGTAEPRYQYYDAESGTLTDLSAVKTTSQLDNIQPIVTLTKTNDTDRYYTAHIRVRIWAEGTDREAKTPLAGGTFNTELVFEGKPVDSP